MIDLTPHKNHIEHEKTVVKIAMASEKGKTYRMVNSSKYHVTKIHIDGGVFTQTLSCDFLFLTHSFDNDKFKNHSAFLVELKGTNVKHAVNQIDNTIKIMNFARNEFVLQARIVASKGMPLHVRPANYVSLDEQLRKQGGNLICKTNLLEETV
jgi:hypothetical protein